MKKDVIELIEFSGDTQGRLNFNYLQDVDNIGNEFTEPGRKTQYMEKSEGMLWLVRLMEGKSEQLQ